MLIFLIILIWVVKKEGCINVGIMVLVIGFLLLILIMSEVFVLYCFIVSEDLVFINL